MSKTRKLPSRLMPTKLPLYPSIITWMALDYYHSPDWAYGALGVLFALIWGSAIYSMATEEEIATLSEITEELAKKKQ